MIYIKNQSVIGNLLLRTAKHLVLKNITLIYNLPKVIIPLILRLHKKCSFTQTLYMYIMIKDFSYSEDIGFYILIIYLINFNRL